MNLGWLRAVAAMAMALALLSASGWAYISWRRSGARAAWARKRYSVLQSSSKAWRRLLLQSVSASLSDIATWDESRKTVLRSVLLAVSHIIIAQSQKTGT